jgi:hypothetical protein
MLYQLSYAGRIGVERETGIEPATNRLEICDSTIELLPQILPYSSKGCHPECNPSTVRFAPMSIAAGIPRSAPAKAGLRPVAHDGSL